MNSVNNWFTFSNKVAAIKLQRRVTENNFVYGDLMGELLSVNFTRTIVYSLPESDFDEPLHG